MTYKNPLDYRTKLKHAMSIKLEPFVTNILLYSNMDASMQIVFAYHCLEVNGNYTTTILLNSSLGCTNNYV